MKPVDYRNQTILVTGASSGIGVAFARALAGRGANLVLVARRLDRLETLATELQAAHGIRATAIKLDLGSAAAGQALRQATDDLGLSITGVVNNAGFGTDGPFHDEDPEKLADEIAVDIAALVDISRAYIEPLRAASPGILVNLASVAAHQPIPGMAVYSASKAFVLNFTEALWFESRSTGLRVLALSPGLTKTEFFDVLGADEYKGSYETPEQVVQTALKALDRNHQPSVTSGRRNAFLASAARLFTRRRAVIIAASFGSSSSGTQVTAAQVTAEASRRS